jgi:hypothetical protein
MFKDFSTLSIRCIKAKILKLRVAPDVPEDDFGLWYDAVYAGDIHKLYCEEWGKLLLNVATRQP